MVPILILLVIFGSPVALIAVLRHYRYLEKQLEGGLRADEAQRLLARCEELEQRVQTLETIACEGDLDTAARMRSLLGRRDPALPQRAAAPRPALSAAASEADSK